MCREDQELSISPSCRLGGFVPFVRGVDAIFPRVRLCKGGDEHRTLSIGCSCCPRGEPESETTAQGKLPKFQAGPEVGMSEVDPTRLRFYSELAVGLANTITGIDPAGKSSRSEHMRAIETPRACLLVFHTAGEDDGTGSSTRKFVPRPSAIA
jgi:hypothetical protein